jgi:hypothetical protein
MMNYSVMMGGGREGRGESILPSIPLLLLLFLLTAK